MDDQADAFSRPQDVTGSHRITLDPFESRLAPGRLGGVTVQRPDAPAARKQLAGNRAADTAGGAENEGRRLHFAAHDNHLLRSDERIMPPEGNKRN